MPTRSSARRARPGLALVLLALATAGCADSDTPKPKPTPASTSMATPAHLAEARLRAARAAVDAMGIALDTFEVDLGRYPSTAEGLAALVTRPDGLATWKRAYLATSVPADPWGKAYHYRQPGEHNPAGYDLSSAGPDGQAGTADDIGNWAK